MRMISIAMGLLMVGAVARGDTRGDFLKMIERPRGELKAVVRETAAKDAGVRMFHFTFESSPGRSGAGGFDGAEWGWRRGRSWRW